MRIASNPALRVRQAEKHEAVLYGTVAAQGWSEHPEVMPYIKDFAKSSLACATCFIANRYGGEPIPTAALFMHNGTALLAGADTPCGWSGRAERAARQPITNCGIKRLRFAMMIAAARRSATPSGRDSG